MIISRTGGEKAMAKFKKTVSLTLCATLVAASLAGCGKSESGSNSSNTSSDYDHIYKEVDFDLSTDVDTDYLYNMFSYGDRIVACGSSYDDEGNNSTYNVVSFNTDGSDVVSFSINNESTTDGESVYISEICCDENGDFYLTKNLYSYSEDNSYDIYNLDKYSSDGEFIWEVNLSENGNETSVEEMCYVEGKGVLISGSEKMALYSAEDGSLIKNYETNINYIENIIPKDGNVLLNYWEDDGYAFKEYNLTDGTFGDDVSFPGSLSNYNYCLKGTYSDLLLLSRNGIYTYNFGDQEVTYVCSYIDSDIDPDYVEGVAQVSADEFILLVMDQEDYTYKFTKIVKVPAKEAMSQQIITLGCYWMDSNIRRAVIDFNKTNTKYRISVKDYSMYDTDTDYDAGITKLNTDIVGGDVPDIILASTEMPMESYIAKGIFEDLEPLIESDDEFDMDDYLQNIFDAFRRDGKLYSVVPAFSVFTIAAATSNLDGKTSWTMSEMEQIADSKNIAYKDMFGVGYSRNDIMSIAVYLNETSYIDWDNHECHFDSDEFKQFLSFMKEFPEQIDYSTIYSTDTSDYYRKGKALAAIMYMGDFSDYTEDLRGEFGEDITLIGFPSDSSSGSAIIPSVEICISSSTSKEDGCWEFIKGLFDDDFQQSLAQYGYFPVEKSLFEKLADNQMKASTWTNDDGTEETYVNTTYIGGVEVEITPLTQKERDYIVNFIESLDQRVDYNEEILNIISEEAEAYFNGQKSVDDVASIIQSRINIYVNENS